MSTIALIDDHKIFCDSLVGLINDFDAFKAIWCVPDGSKAIQLLQGDNNDRPKRLSQSRMEWTSQK